MTNPNAGTMTAMRLLSLIYCDAYDHPEEAAPMAEQTLLESLREVDKAKWAHTMPAYEAQRKRRKAQGEKEATRQFIEDLRAGKSTDLPG